MKRLIALVLSLVMALSLCAPAGGEVASPTDVPTPTATVKELGAKTIRVHEYNENNGNMELDTSFQFLPNEKTASDYYKDWHADFVVKADRDVPGNSMALAGYYEAWCSLIDYKWVALSTDQVIPANTEVRLVASMNGITVSYEEICNYGGDGIGFLCGAADLTGVNEGTTLTVELRLYKASEASIDSETGEYISIGTYNHTFAPVAKVGDVEYKSLQEALNVGGDVKIIDTINADTEILPWGEAYSQYTAEYMMSKGGSVSGGEIVMDEDKVFGLVIEVGADATCTSKVDDVEITGNSESVLYVGENGGHVTLSDVTVNANGGSGIYAEWAQGGVTLDNCTVVQNGCSTGHDAHFETAIAAAQGAEIVVNGGTYSSTKYAVYVFPSGGTVTINSGIFTGELKADNPDDKIIIKGGTFSVDPTPYVADGYGVFEVDEGGYLVAKSCKVTFDANGGKNELTQPPVPAGVFTLPENPFTYEGKQFKAWSVNGKEYAVGDKISVSSDITVVAVWVDVVIVPVPDVENKETPVKVEAAVDGSTATINKVENLDKITESEVKTESVTLDFSEVKGTTENTETSVNTVVIPSAVVEDIVEVVTSENKVDNLEIVTANATVSFDAEAVETISDNAADNAAVSLTVDVEKVSTATDVTAENQEAFEEVMEKDGSENAVLLSIELVDEHGNELFSDKPTTAGTATVKVKLADGLKSATLYYLDGSDAVKLGSYNADADGYITVTLKHFSEYVLLGSTDKVYSGGYYYPIVSPEKEPVEKPTETKPVEKPAETKPVEKPVTPPVEEVVTPAPEDTTPVVPDEPVVDDAPVVEEPQGSSAGLWIGVGIVALAAIVVVLAVMVVRKKRK